MQIFLRSLAFIVYVWVATSAQTVVLPPGPTRNPILRIETGAHTASIMALSVDAANRFFVTASIDKTVRVWELPSGRLVRVLRPPVEDGYEGRLYAVAISPDGNTIAAAGWTGLEWDIPVSIYIFDRESGRLLRRLNDLPDIVTSLVYSPDGRFLAARTITSDGLRIYQTTDFALARIESGCTGKIRGADFDRLDRLATSCDDGYVRVHAGLETSGAFQLAAKQKFAAGQIPSDVKFSPDGLRLAIAFGDVGKAVIVKASDLSLVYVHDVPAPFKAPVPPGGYVGPKPGDEINIGVAKVVWSADGKRLGAVNFQGTAFLWPADRSSKRVDESLSIIDLVPLRDGGFLYGTRDSAIGILDSNGSDHILSVANIAQFHFRFHTLTLAADGAGVRFQFDRLASTSAQFSFSDRRLDTVSSPIASWSSAKTDDVDLQISDWETSSPKLNDKPIHLVAGEQSVCRAIAPDSTSFLLGTNIYLRLYDRNGLPLWSTLVPAGTNEVNITRNGNLAVATLHDGTIRWYRMTDGKELLAFFPHADRKRWVAWTPEGFYDCSPGAEDLIGWQVNNGKDQAADYYPVGQFFEKFYNPKLLAQVLTPDGVQPLNANARNTLRIDKDLRKPPLVSITSPKPGASFDSDAVRIDVAAADQGGGVDEIRLYQNGKLVSDDTRMLVEGAAENNKIFNVTLVPGINTFRATAFNKDRTEANPVEIQIELKAVEAASDLYIMAVGLNDYKNSKYSLNYGRADAQAFADAAETHGRGIFKHINKQVVLDEQATRKGIEDAFAKVIAAAKPSDAFVFYFAGHGVMSEGEDASAAEFYLVPFDVVQLYGNDGALATNGVAAKLLKEMCTKVRAQKQLIVLDACQSAGILETFASRGAAEEKAVLQLARSAGVVVIAATGQDQVASEFPKLGHGVFTYALLQALNGEADGGNPPDGKITAAEIVAFINDRVPELTKQYRGKTQYPNAWVRGQDFPLGVK